MGEGENAFDRFPVRRLLTRCSQVAVESFDLWNVGTTNAAAYTISRIKPAGCVVFAGDLHLGMTSADDQDREQP